MLRKLWDTLRPRKSPDPDWAGLKTAHERLEADFSQLRMEWSTTLDKIVAWSGRQAKRDARALDRLAKEEEATKSPPMLSVESKDDLRRIARSRGLR